MEKLELRERKKMDDVTVGRFAKERKGSVCRAITDRYRSFRPLWEVVLGARRGAREEEAV